MQSSEKEQPDQTAIRHEPDISVIIPHYNDLAALDLCLKLLSAQDLRSRTFEVVVADNGSSVGLQAVIDLAGDRARVIHVAERGAAAARNGAVAASRGSILAFIDSDCQPEPGWLSNGVVGLQQYDFIGGKVRVLVADPAIMTAEEAFERVFAFNFKNYIEKKGFTGSGNLFCSRALFDDVGGFRSTVSEDVEWSHRARAKGYRLGYVPAAVVGHPARRSWAELTTKWRRINSEAYHLAASKPLGTLKWRLRNLALPLTILIHLPRIFRSAELETSAQRLGAAKILIKQRVWRLAHSFRI